MLFLTVILALVAVVLIYILLVPFILFIDTNTHQYYVQLKGVAKAKLLTDKDELLKINLKIFFLNFNFYPLRKNKKKAEKIKKKPIRKRRKNFEFRKILRLLKSFKIKRLYVNIDSGDCITNAKLFPLFTFLNYKVGSFKINFKGTNHMVLHLQNRPIHIIRSFIKI